MIKQSGKCTVKTLLFDQKEVISKKYSCQGPYSLYILREFLIESSILSFSYHPNINKLITIQSCEILLVKEDISLAKLIKETTIPHDTKINYIGQIIKALHYLHCHHILHLDLKPDNIMITNDQVKLIDFGSSEYIFGDCIRSDFNKITIIYRPPECFWPIDGFYYFDYTSDIWCLGMVIAEIFSGIPHYMNNLIPLYNVEIRKIYDKLFYQFLVSSQFSSLVKYVPDKYKDCLNFSKYKRPLISQLLVEKITYNTFQKEFLDSLDTTSLWHKYYYAFLEKNQIDEFPEIIYHTHIFIDNIEKIIGKNYVTKEYIDMIILMCYLIGHNIEKQPCLDNYTINYELINYLIILNKGIIKK
jgi:serine/threonine protein kinase